VSQPIRQASAERQARKLLVAYLTSRARVERLLEWFGQLSWELGESESAPLGLRELANEVQLSLDEYTGGYRTEQQLSKALREALSTYWLAVEMSAGTPFVRTSSQSRSNVQEVLVN